MTRPRIAFLASIAAAAVLAAACGDRDARIVTVESGELDASGTSVPVDAGAVDADSSDAEDGGALVFGPPVACGTVLPGPPLPAGLIEAEPGYAAELTAIGVSKAPDPFEYGSEGKIAIGRINDMLGRSAGTSISHAAALAEPMERAVLAAAVKGGDAGIDNAFVRRGLCYHYACSRPLPKDLSEFKARTDGQLDFAVYTPEGVLSDRSTFATAGGETTSVAPFTCMACHVNAANANATFSVLSPTGTGAGCN